jgi:LasA protease
LHIAAHERVPVGTWVNLNDRIGFPSCEGGISTGTHVHIARKYNGEWILADGPMPFVLSGWRAHAAPELYKGWLTKDGKTITSSLVGNFESRVTR